MPAGPRHREPRRPARLALEPGQTVTWLLRQALPVAVRTGPPPMCGGRFPLAGLQRPRAGQAGVRPPTFAVGFQPQALHTGSAPGPASSLGRAGTLPAPSSPKS